jgi:hypothetical protein
MNPIPSKEWPFKTAARHLYRNAGTTLPSDEETNASRERKIPVIRAALATYGILPRCEAA